MHNHPASCRPATLIARTLKGTAPGLLPLTKIPPRWLHPGRGYNACSLGSDLQSPDSAILPARGSIRWPGCRGAVISARLALLALMLTVPACTDPHGYRRLIHADEPRLRVQGILEATRRHDTTMIPHLIERLEDPDEAVRFFAILALRDFVGTDMGYRYGIDPSRQGPALLRWRRWLEAHRGELGLAPSQAAPRPGSGSSSSRTAAGPAAGPPAPEAGERP